MLLFLFVFTLASLIFIYCFLRFMGVTDTFDLAEIMRQIHSQKQALAEKKAKRAGVS